MARHNISAMSRDEVVAELVRLGLPADRKHATEQLQKTLALKLFDDLADQMRLTDLNACLKHDSIKSEVKASRNDRKRGALRTWLTKDLARNEFLLNLMANLVTRRNEAKVCELALKNPGGNNFCFANSVVTQLANAKPIVQLLAQTEGSQLIRLELKRLLNTQPGNVESVEHLLSLLTTEMMVQECSLRERFDDGRQHDAQEFLRHLLDCLIAQAKPMNREHEVRQKISCEIVDYLECVDCGYTTEKREKAVSFHSVPILWGYSLGQMIQTALSGRERITHSCAQCTSTNCVKGTRVQDSGEVLFVELCV